MTQNEEYEKLQFLLENKFFSYETSYPNDFFLEVGLQELMQKDAPQPQRPYQTQKVTKKSMKSCAVCCVMGLKALHLNEYNDALKAFTNALRVAPYPNVTAICYYWRSVALHRLKAYFESLQDIERALEQSINKEQETNLLKYKKFIQNLLLNNNNQRDTSEKEPIEEEVILSYGENKEIPGVSNAMALVYSIKYGRHYLATRNIKVGDILMIQKPYVFVTSKEGDDNRKGKEWFCENCLKPTKAPIPCYSCAMPFYCSVACRSEAYDKFHKTECRLANVSAPLGPLSSLFLRTFLILTKQGESFEEAVKLTKDIEKYKDKRTAGFKNGKLDGSSGEAVVSLLHHMDKQNLTTVVSNAAQVACALIKHTDFLKRSNDVRSLANLFIFVSYICHRNFYCLRRNTSDNIIALTLYPVLNLLNHSCACNTLSYNDKHGNTILRACKNIEKGEQIFVSYNTFDVMIMSSQERKNVMQKAKFFTCECEACEQNYTYDVELMGTLKIPVQLKNKLNHQENDTKTLWQVLRLILELCPRPSLEAKTLELALVEAYLGSDNKGLYKRLVHLNLI